MLRVKGWEHLSVCFRVRCQVPPRVHGALDEQVYGPASRDDLSYVQGGSEGSTLDM
jgi:hypothetical protein